MILNSDSPKTAELPLLKIGTFRLGVGVSWPVIMKTPFGYGTWLVPGLASIVLWFGKSKRIQAGPRLFGFGLFLFAAWGKDRS
jgi:hypothetical protein